MKSTNPIVNNALAANAKNGISMKEAKELADILKSRPWDTPEYKAKVKADLDRSMRQKLGDKGYDELVKTLKKVGWWKG